MTKPAERRAARLAAVQALYQMEVSGKGVIDALAEFEAFWIGREVEGISFEPAENAFFRDILAGVVREQRPIDGKIDAALAAGWPLKRVEAVLRAILRAGRSSGQPSPRTARACGRRGTTPIGPGAACAPGRRPSPPTCACRSRALPNASTRRSATLRPRA